MASRRRDSPKAAQRPGRQAQPVFCFPPKAKRPSCLASTKTGFSASRTMADMDLSEYNDRSTSSLCISVVLPRHISAWKDSRAFFPRTRYMILSIVYNDLVVLSTQTTRDGRGQEPYTTCSGMCERVSCVQCSHRRAIPSRDGPFLFLPSSGTVERGPSVQDWKIPKGPPYVRIRRRASTPFRHRDPWLRTRLYDSIWPLTRTTNCAII
jgi:hypothetical protein